MTTEQQIAQQLKDYQTELAMRAAAHKMLNRDKKKKQKPITAR